MQEFGMRRIVPMGRPVKLAVVGGHRGRAFNRTLETLSDKVALTAVCDISEEVLAQWRGEYPGIRTFKSYDELLEGADCDAVFIATPLMFHAQQAIRAMEAGKHVLSEVIAATTLDECWKLVETVERTELVYMMAENYCYMRPNMMILNMVRRGIFGNLIYAEGAYIHDCRHLMFDENGKLTWRGTLRRDYNCNTYPTHSLGPVSQWLGINRTDRLASTATWMSPSASSKRYAARNYGVDSPAARENYACGDSATTVIRTERGAIIVLRVDWASPRPHNMTHYVLQGTTASYVSARYHGEDPLVWIEGRSPAMGDGTAAEWESLWKYAGEFEHPRWREREEEAVKSGHGGGDFFVLEDFVDSILNGTKPPIDVYDAVTWSSIFPLSIESVKRGGAPVDIPDFTGGKRH
ncbi:MAG: Gfo/Idh/MocA family protein [bacterium]